MLYSYVYSDNTKYIVVCQYSDGNPSFYIPTVSNLSSHHQPSIVPQLNRRHTFVDVYGYQVDTHCGTPTTTTRPPLYGPSEQPSLSTLLPLPSLVLTSVFDIYYIELVILLDKSIDAYIIPFPCNICPNIIKMQMNHCYVMYELVDTAHTHWPIRDRSRSTRLFTSTILAVHKLGRRFSQLNICWQKVFQYNFGI